MGWVFWKNPPGLSQSGGEAAKKPQAGGVEGGGPKEDPSPDRPWAGSGWGLSP